MQCRKNENLASRARVFFDVRRGQQEVTSISGYGILDSIAAKVRHGFYDSVDMCGDDFVVNDCRSVISTVCMLSKRSKANYFGCLNTRHEPQIRHSVPGVDRPVSLRLTSECSSGSAVAFTHKSKDRMCIVAHQAMLHPSDDHENDKTERQ